MQMQTHLGESRVERAPETPWRYDLVSCQSQAACAGAHGPSPLSATLRPSLPPHRRRRRSTAKLLGNMPHPMLS